MKPAMITAATAVCVALSSLAHAQQDIDTLYRVAYCVGVLKADLKWQTSSEGTAREREVFGILCSFPGGSCPAQSAEQWMQRHLDRIETRRQRYAAYLLARTSGRPNGVMLGLIDKGEKEGWSDTSNLRETRDTLKRHPVSICWEAAHKAVRAMGATWDEDEQRASIIECVARKDQPYADRMACREIPIGCRSEGAGVTKKATGHCLVGDPGDAGRLSAKIRLTQMQALTRLTGMATKGRNVKSDTSTTDAQRAQ